MAQEADANVMVQTSESAEAFGALVSKGLEKQDVEVKFLPGDSDAQVITNFCALGSQNATAIIVVDQEIDRQETPACNAVDWEEFDESVFVAKTNNGDFQRYYLYVKRGGIEQQARIAADFGELLAGENYAGGLCDACSGRSPCVEYCSRCGGC